MRKWKKQNKTKKEGEIKNNMARELLPYFNASAYGEGAEGAANYANLLVNNLAVPAFLLVIYAISLYVWSKSEYQMGGGVFFISLFLFLMAIIAQTFTAFPQLIIFIFAIGIIIGIVMHFVEGSR